MVVPRPAGGERRPKDSSLFFAKFTRPGVLAREGEGGKGNSSPLRGEDKGAEAPNEFYLHPVMSRMMPL